MQSNRTSKRIKKLAEHLEVSEEAVLAIAIDRLYNSEMDKARRDLAEKQGEYYKAHPEEAEFMLKIQGLKE